MTSSKKRALVVLIVVVLVGGLGSAAAWRHTHPEATSPLAALSPMAPASAPAPVAAPPPVKTAAAPAPVSAAASPMAAARPAPAGPHVADLGPEPPAAPNPVSSDTSAGSLPTAGDPPSFDVVRVEPSGETVVAGKGKPSTDVALIASGQIVAEGKTDSNGQFVLIPPPLKPGSYDLTLRQGQGASAQPSRQAVAVAIPDKGKGDVVVALAEPGQPTKILSAPAAPPAAATPEIAAAPSAAAGTPVAIRSVELENGNGFFATGRAAPGTHLHIYLNDSHIADVAAAADGQWTLRIGKGLTGGHYTVRADALKQDGRTVASRVEVPFDVPVAMAKGQVGPAAGRLQVAAGESKTKVAGSAEIASAATARSAAEPGPVGSVSPGDAHQPPSRGSDAVIESVDTALVARGDNLWDISRVRLGNGTRYTRIYTANAGQIRDPNLIYPGQVFVVPHD